MTISTPLDCPNPRSDGLRRWAAVVIPVVAALSVVGVWALPADAGGSSGSAGDVSAVAAADRVAGTDRYATSVEVARQVGGGSLTGLTRLIVVTGEAFPDGLTASGLAGYLDNGGRSGRTAILLTRTGSLPPVVEQAIRTSGVSASNVFVVGGTSAVSDDVYRAIGRAAGWNGVGANPVTRIAGADRYQTAAAIVEFVKQRAGGSLPGSYRTVLVANGQDFPDALAGGTLAYRNGHLIVLSRPPSAPPVSLDAVEVLPADCAILLGGTAALSAQVAGQVAGVLVPGGCGIDRIGGANRYQTAALIASRFVNVNGPASQVLLVSGVEFPDALTAAPLAGGNRPMLLTGPAQLPDPTAAWLRANSTSLRVIMVVGGPNVIPPGVVNQAVAASSPTPTPTTTPGPTSTTTTTTTTTVPGPTTTTTTTTSTTTTTTSTTTTTVAPSVSWPVQAGGLGSDNSYSVSALADGSGAIVTGEFRGAVAFGTTTLDSGDPNVTAVFVAKIDTSGNWVWAVGAGGNAARGKGVVTLADGSAIVTGFFATNITFAAVDTVSGTTPIELTAGDSGEIFVARVNASGKWVWAVSDGTEGLDYGEGITLAGDSVIVTGSEGADIYVAKFAVSDGTRAWETTVEATGDSYGYAVSALSDGSAIVTGEYQGTVTFSATTLSLVDPNISGAFVAKIAADGQSWAWAAEVDGPGSDAGSGVSVLADGSAIVTGSFAAGDPAGEVTFTPSTGPISLTAVGSRDGFVAKIDASGQWSWAAQASGATNTRSRAVVTLSDGSAIVTGQIRGAGTFMSAGGSGSIPLSVVNRDLFVAKINDSGNWVWASGAGGTGAEAEGRGVTVLLGVSNSGNILVTGGFEGTVAFGLESLTSNNGSEDVFVARLSAAGAFG